MKTRVSVSFIGLPRFLALMMVSALFAFPSVGSAALKTWDGTSSGNWGTSGNWTPAGIPADGDDLIFPAGALNLSNTNNITDLRLNSIQFNGASGAYVLRGNALTISNGVVAAHTAGVNSLNLDAITNAASQTYTVDSGGTLTVNSDLVLLSTFTLVINNDFSVSLLGIISGTGGLTKSSAGVGTLRIGGLVNNTYTGNTTVNGGLLELDDSAGATAIMVSGDLVINSFGTVILQEPDQIANGSDLTIGGTLDLGGQTDTVGTVTFNGGTINTGVGQ